MSCLAEYDKDPVDVLTLNLDWEDWLDGDRLTNSSWSGFGLGVTDGGHTNSVASVIVSGGATGGIYELANTVATQQGRTEVRRLRVSVKRCPAPPSIEVGWNRGEIT